MAVNKVEYAGNTLIDLTADTVTAETLMQGVTAHGANGEAITGTLVPVADPTLQSKTVTPSASVQSVTADAGYDGLDTVTVNAIPGEYVKPAATKGAATYTPKTTAQTIAAGTYCSGAQTIAGDANLVAANIVSGKTIFGVAGSAASGGKKIATGSFTASSKATSKSITHSLNATPNYVAVYKNNSNNATATIAAAYLEGSTKKGVYSNPVSSSSNALGTGTPTISVTSTTVSISGWTVNTYTTGFYGGYNYIIGVI